MDSNYWNEFARRWRHVGPPWRPAEEDSQILRAALDQEAEPRRVLLLGVTPEIVTLDWPATVRLFAIDRNLAMLRLILPRPQGLDLTAICADWRDLPLDTHSMDLVVGDNPVTAFEPFGQLARWVEEMHRVLRPGGVLALRFFLRPARPTSVEELFADLNAGHMPSVHSFKLRLFHALHGTLEQGVRPADLWETWQDHEINPTALPRNIGWSEDYIRTLEIYRGSSVVYSFPTAEEMSAIMADRFIEISRHFPTYDQGDLFPTVVYHAR